MFQEQVVVLLQSRTPAKLEKEEEKMITTVGDQIFSMKQEIKKLRKECKMYRDLLRSRNISTGRIEEEIPASKTEVNHKKALVR